MSFCPYCGHTLEPDAAFCPSCGKRVPTQGAAAGISPPPYPTSQLNLGPPPSIYGDADRKALGRLWTASIIFLVMFVAGIGADLIFIGQFSKFFIFTPPAGGVGGAPPNFHFFTGIFFTYLVITLTATGVIEILALILVRSSFKNLESVDRSHFHMPSILTLLALVALPFVLIGLVIELSALPAFMNSISQQTTSGVPPTLSSPAFGSFFIGTAIEGLGGLIGVIGFIGGIMLGLWRVGRRYDSTLIKVSAILLIIPIADIIVPILMFIGVWQSRNKVSMSIASPTAASVK